MSGRPGVFVDRDGTLIEERRYLSDPEAVTLISGTVQALEEFRRAGLPVVVVTNQSGIARGLYSLEDYHAVAARLVEILERADVPVAAVEYCPHHPDHPDHSNPGGRCDCRKPGTGMYRSAAKHLGLDLARSWYIGDKYSDVEPAVSLGGTGVLVRTGYGHEHEFAVDASVHVVDDLRAAARLICS